MDFTPEQQAAIDAEVSKKFAAALDAQNRQMVFMEQQQANALALQVSNQNAAAALQKAQADAAAEAQAVQAASALELQAKQARLTAVQLAQSTLIANRNNQPVDAREISPADIAAYAEALTTYING